MTIRLLAKHSKYNANTIVTLDAATEAGLIAAKLATTDLLGGVPYVEPVIQNQQFPVLVEVDPSGKAVAVVGGGLPVSLGSPPPSTFPVPLATIGDSLATCSDIAAHDLTKVAAADAAGKGLYSYRIGANVMGYSNGMVRVVADCGIGGQTTTQILARDIAAAGVNRRAIQDAANCRAKVAYVSAGINNIIQNVRAGWTQAQIDTVLATVYAEVEAIMRRTYALGMYPILRQLGGFGVGSYTTGASLGTADVARCVDAIKQAAAFIQNTLVPSLGFGELLDIRPLTVDAATGAWLPGLASDELHENQEGARIISKMLAKAVMRWAGYASATSQFAPALVPIISANAFTGPLLLAEASGFGSGITSYAASGSSSKVGQVVTFEGVRWQEVVVTPITFAGSYAPIAPSGVQKQLLQIPAAIFGATPAVPVSVGSLVQFEYEFTIDDGNGGAPLNVVNYGGSINVIHSGGTLTFYARSTQASAASIQVPQGPIRQKVICPPIAMPAASADITNAFLILDTQASSTVPYRVRCSLVRIHVVQG